MKEKFEACLLISEYKSNSILFNRLLLQTGEDGGQHAERMDEEDPPLPGPDDRGPPDRHVRARSAACFSAAVLVTTVSTRYVITMHE